MEPEESPVTNTHGGVCVHVCGTWNRIEHPSEAGADFGSRLCGKEIAGV